MNFGKTRSTLLASFEDIIDSINSAGRNQMENQVSMFDLLDDSENTEEIKYTFTELPEMETKEYLSLEKEMLGIYLSGHPLEKFKNKIKNLTNINSLDILEIDTEMNETGNTIKYQDGENIKIVGIISKVKKKITKNNSLMAFVTLDDLYGSFETIVFESIFNKCAFVIEEEKIVLLEGRLSIREDEPTKIIASNFKELINEDKEISCVTVNITDFSEDKKENLRNFIRYYSKLENARTNIDVIVGNEIRKCGKIFADKEIIKKLENTFGKEYLTIS